MAVNALLYLKPETGLLILWKIVIPSLPFTFLIIPGIWRNVCPIATINQIPRVFGFSKGITHTPLMKKYIYIISLMLFLTLVLLRKMIFNSDGEASGILITSTFILAFSGGFIFKGKSGWCSSFCPVLPVERLYGQTPFIMTANSHCRPCIGCTKHCYDFNPSAAYLAEQYGSDSKYAVLRRIFAAVFPGFILSYFLIPVLPEIKIAETIFITMIFMLISGGIFFLLDYLLKLSITKLTTIFTAAAFSIYYWFSIPVLTGSVRKISGLDFPVELNYILTGLVYLMVLYWVYRTFITERKFILKFFQSEISQNLKLSSRAMASLHINSVNVKKNI